MNETTNEQEVLLLRRKLDLLLRTGKLLMESAADTNRIERNMKRVAAYLGIPEEKLHIDIRWTMLMVNVSDEKHSFSKFQKCEKHGINMEAISKISKLYPMNNPARGVPLSRIIHWINTRKNLRRLLVRSVIIPLMSWQSVPGLLVEGSASCLVVTGLLF